eukprot:SAG31_NODE_1363_length_8627_cov_5.967402_9_plen_251_part_00
MHSGGRLGTAQRRQPGASRGKAAPNTAPNSHFGLGTPASSSGRNGHGAQRGHTSGGLSCRGTGSSSISTTRAVDAAGDSNVEVEHLPQSPGEVVTQPQGETDGLTALRTPARIGIGRRRGPAFQDSTRRKETAASDIAHRNPDKAQVMAQKERGANREREQGKHTEPFKHRSIPQPNRHRGSGGRRSSGPRPDADEIEKKRKELQHLERSYAARFGGSEGAASNARCAVQPNDGISRSPPPGPYNVWIYW